MNGHTPELSVVIPAYNEEGRLGGTLDRIHEYFEKQLPSPANIEIIVVDDGSTDGTRQVAQDYARRMPCLRILTNGRNRGKGYSVRRGMLEARGRVALFTDADLSSPIEESQKLLAAIAAGNDLAIGSRAVDRTLIAVHQSPYREAAGIVFNKLAQLATGLSFLDTQCGFKAFVLNPCRVLFEQQRIHRFGFDPEVLFLARRHGLRTAEVPVRWSHDPATKVNVVRDGMLMVGGLACILWNSLLQRYPKKP